MVLEREKQWNIKVKVVEEDKQENESKHILTILKHLIKWMFYYIKRYILLQKPIGLIINFILN